MDTIRTDAMGLDGLAKLRPKGEKGEQWTAFPKLHRLTSDTPPTCSKRGHQYKYEVYTALFFHSAALAF